MSHPIPAAALIVIADGAKAILFHNTGTAAAPVLQEQQRLSQKDFVDNGPSGSRPEEQSPHETGEATFAKQLAKHLEKMHNQNDFTSLVLIADPQTLGQLRDAMHKNLQKTVAFTLSKDYTNHSTAQITAALS